MKPASRSSALADVGVVLLNWNGFDLTRDCVRSLLAGSVVPRRILIVDNGSRDGSGERLAAEYAREDVVRVARIYDNCGFTGGNNFGAALLLEEGLGWIWVLNNDTLVEHDCLARLLAYAAARAAATALSAKILFADVPTMIWYGGGDIGARSLMARHRGERATDDGRFDAPGRVTFLSGCCMLIRANTLRAIGLFNDDFGLYCEDTEWCARAIAHRMELHYVPSAVLLHRVTATIHKNSADGSGGTSTPYSIYHTVRNRLYVARLHARGWRLAGAILMQGGYLAYYAAGLAALRRWRKLPAVMRGARDGVLAPVRATAPLSVRVHADPTKWTAL